MSIVVDGVMFVKFTMIITLLFCYCLLKYHYELFLIDNFRRSVDVDLVIIAACCFCAIDNLHIT